jgi:hypothetical protein
MIPKKEFWFVWRPKCGKYTNIYIYRLLFRRLHNKYNIKINKWTSVNGTKKKILIIQQSSQAKQVFHSGTEEVHPTAVTSDLKTP